MRRLSVLLAFVLAIAVTSSALAFSPFVDTTTTVNDLSLTFSSGWTSGTCAPCYSGQTSYTLTSGAYWTYTFTGNSFYIYDIRDSSMGKAEVFVDGVSVFIYDAYSLTTIYDSLLYSQTGLSNASHTVKVVALHQKNISSSDYYVQIDKFVYITSSFTSTPSPTFTPTRTSTPSPTFTPTSTSVPASPTYTSVPASPTYTSLPPTATSLSTFTSVPPTSTFTAVPSAVPTFTSTPVSTPVPSSNDTQLFVLSLPLLFVDWQIAIIWTLSLLNSSFHAYLASLDYQGFEYFLAFLIVGIFRRFLFPKG